MKPDIIKTTIIHEANEPRWSPFMAEMVNVIRLFCSIEQTTLIENHDIYQRLKTQLHNRWCWAWTLVIALSRCMKRLLWGDFWAPAPHDLALKGRLRGAVVPSAQSLNSQKLILFNVSVCSQLISTRNNSCRCASIMDSVGESLRIKLCCPTLRLGKGCFTLSIAAMLFSAAAMLVGIDPVRVCCIDMKACRSSSMGVADCGGQLHLLWEQEKSTSDICEVYHMYSTNLLRLYFIFKY